MADSHSISRRNEDYLLKIYGKTRQGFERQMQTGVSMFNTQPIQPEFHNVKDNQIELLKEDLECVHQYLDEKLTPRNDSYGKAYSIIGRIKFLEKYCYNPMIIKSDNICPSTNKPCDDECCPVGAVCNLANSDDILDTQEPENERKEQQPIKPDFSKKDFIPAGITVEEVLITDLKVKDKCVVLGEVFTVTNAEDKDGYWWSRMEHESGAAIDERYDFRSMKFKPKTIKRVQ